MLNPAEKPLVSSLHHVAVVVRDVDAAARYYRAVFGLRDIERLTAQGSQHRGAWFQVGALELHLQERTDDCEKTDQHFALLTERFDEILTRVKQQGGRTEEARLINGVSKRAFVYDLDENRIELLQK